MRASPGRRSSTGALGLECNTSARKRSPYRSIAAAIHRMSQMLGPEPQSHGGASSTPS